MIAITFAMELTVLCVSLYWQSSLVLACGRLLFPRVASGAGIQLWGPSGRGRAGSGMLRLAPGEAALKPVQQHPPEMLGRSAVGARRTCLRGFGTRAGDRLVLSPVLLLGTFS